MSTVEITRRQSIEATNFQTGSVRNVYPGAKCVGVGSSGLVAICANPGEGFIPPDALWLSAACVDEASAWRFAYLNVMGA